MLCFGIDLLTVCADVFCIPDIYVIIVVIFYFFLEPALMGYVLLVSSHLWQINIVVGKFCKNRARDSPLGAINLYWQNSKFSKFWGP